MFFFFSIFVYVKKQQQDTPISGACVHKRMPKLAVDGCCEAAAYGIRPWTPWIWGILNFRSIRVIYFLLEPIRYQFVGDII
jgi:hypothetical protein